MDSCPKTISVITLKYFSFTFSIIAGWIERVCKWVRFLCERRWKQLQCWSAAVSMPGTCNYQEQYDLNSGWSNSKCGSPVSNQYIFRLKIRGSDQQNLAKVNRFVTVLRWTSCHKYKLGSRGITCWSLNSAPDGGECLSLWQ